MYYFFSPPASLKHDGLEKKDAWFIEEVEVTNMNSDETFLFKCHNWLSLYHGDGEVKRVIKAEQVEIEGRGGEVF